MLHWVVAVLTVVITAQVAYGVVECYVIAIKWLVACNEQRFFQCPLAPDQASREIIDHLQGLYEGTKLRKLEE